VVPGKEKFFQKGICQFLYNIIKHSKDEALLEAVDKTITNLYIIKKEKCRILKREI